MMNKPFPSPSSESNDLEKVHDLIEVFTQRVSRGDPTSPEEFAAEYPRHQDILRRILPASQLLFDLSGTDRDSPGTTTKTEMRERVLGDFRILGELGRGGMGVVYEAEQISLARRVALKVLPFAAVLDKRQLQRFKIEAQAAGALDHPHIVHVYSVGCE